MQARLNGFRRLALRREQIRPWVSRTISVGTGSIPATYDGPLELQPSVPVKASCYDRKFPGDGEFPNAPIVSVLAPNDGLNQIRHEVFSAILADECGTGQPHQCGLL